MDQLDRKVDRLIQKVAQHLGGLSQKLADNHETLRLLVESQELTAPWH